MGKYPPISVVIPLYDVGWCISTQLKALAVQDYLGVWELVLVDNGSSDGTVEIVTSQTTAYPVPVIICVADDVTGSSHARNKGIEVATGELICFCDADDRVDPKWISDLVEAHCEGSIVAGINRTWDGSEIPNMNPGWCSAAGPHLGGPPIAMGCNMLVSKADALAIGGFDTSFITGQDADFSWKFQKTGGIIIAAAGAYVDYREKSGIMGNFLRNIQYGIDDIRLIKRYIGIFKFDIAFKTHPRYRPPIRQLMYGVRTREAGGLVHASRIWGKYLGHIIGRLKCLLLTGGCQ